MTKRIGNDKKNKVAISRPHLGTFGLVYTCLALVFTPLARHQWAKDGKDKGLNGSVIASKAKQSQSFVPHTTGLGYFNNFTHI